MKEAWYFSSIINLNRNNPKFLFDTVKGLTQKQTQTVGSSIVAGELMDFFQNKIQSIREEIDACRATCPTWTWKANKGIETNNL